MITTHVLDVALGRPAAGVSVVLRRRTDAGWDEVGRGDTDADGRLKTLVPAGVAVAPGVYSLTFGVGDYHAAQGVEGFYPEASIVFTIRQAGHYHVPLLLSPFGYSTYRGS